MEDAIDEGGRPSIVGVELVEYLIEIGGVLLAHGCPTHRVESLVGEVARLEGHEAQVFGVPTGLFLSVRGPTLPAAVFRMTRVKEWGVDLDRLAHVDRIFNDVLARKMTLRDAREALHAIETRPRAYSTPVRWLAAAGAAGAAAIFFRASFAEVPIAALAGLLIGMLRTFLARTERARVLEDFAGALLASSVAWIATFFDPALSREVLVLSPVILLVPGMALTGGLAELAHRNLVSGAAKLMEAMIVFLSILFGIALLVVVEQLLDWRPMAAPHRPELPWPWDVGAVLVSSLCFGITFSVPRRLLAFAVVSGSIGWVVSALGARSGAPALAAFAASFCVCAFANISARMTQRPSQVFMLPGLVLLVPGSFGFLSLEAFLRGEFLGGAAKGFEMFLIGAAIVTGILVANVTLPARKLL